MLHPFDRSRHLPARLMQRLCAWAAVAMLLAALAPALSAVLAESRNDARDAAAWLVLCSTSSQPSKQGADADDARDDASGMAGGSSSHCPFCHLDHPVLGAPQAPLLAELDAGRARRQPAAFLHAPRRLFAWLRAPSRAPPALA